MIISVAAFAAALLPFLLGGRLSGLSSVPFKGVAWIVTALLVQIVIIEMLPGPRLLLQMAHVATYVVAGWFVVANWRVPGLWLIGTGASLNGLAIALNGGTLPARPEALKAAGLQLTTDQFVNSGVLANPRLGFLGDVFAIPHGLPLANVFSVGDVIVVVGAGWTAWAILGTRWTQPWTPPPERWRRRASGKDAGDPDLSQDPQRWAHDRASQSEQTSAVYAAIPETGKEATPARQDRPSPLEAPAHRNASEPAVVAPNAVQTAHAALDAAHEHAERALLDLERRVEHMLTLQQLRLTDALGAPRQT
jgi:hypothetical protein